MSPAGTDPKTGRFEGGGRVIFGFLDDINNDWVKELCSIKKCKYDILAIVPWYAELTLKVKDVAVLLKSGLFWTEANIDPTNNYFDDRKLAPHLSSERFNLGNSYGRFYELRDTEPAQWHGTLMVRAHAISTLHQFRPSQLSLANVLYVTAKNRHGQTVYHFDSTDRDLCFSAILDDTPLEGWWPWPKKEDTDDDSTQKDLDAELKQEKIDDSSMQEDIDAGLMQEDNDNASTQEDSDDISTQEDMEVKLKQEEMNADSMQDDIPDESMQEDLDDDSMQEDTDNDSTPEPTDDDSTLEDADDDLSDQ
ncbi:hypothetical protein BBO_06823 [Beauveria brongniartii RCEF 3172]|uniref:Uncharacterized protein n=1 Tax=Beauveria brongniartii RCEF 3172 TaxID=1081107 RepID=A0A167AJC4_9HYPO|nr:hypothetical protein BBO_06823 [Beauveria brongniartii RCEF 3172]